MIGKCDRAKAQNHVLQEISAKDWEHVTHMADTKGQCLPLAGTFLDSMINNALRVKGMEALAQ